MLNISLVTGAIWLLLMFRITTSSAEPNEKLVAIMLVCIATEFVLLYAFFFH